MHILTEDNQIINTANYRIGFERNRLVAYSLFRGRDNDGGLILIGTFGDNTEAETALKDIFNAIYQENKIWSAAEYKDERDDSSSDETPSAETPSDETPSDDMSLLDWPKWEQDVAKIIIEMYEMRDPSGQMLFRPKDLRDYHPRLKNMWPGNNNIGATISRKLADLIERGVLEKPTYSQYRIVEGQLLFLHLKLRILTQNSQ